LKITDKRFEQLSLEKKIEIICNNILYSDIMGIQLRVVKESKRGKRVKAAEEEEKKNRGGEQASEGGGEAERRTERLGNDI